MKYSLYSISILSALIILFSRFPVAAQCLEGNCTFGEGKFKFESGAIYEGSFRNNKPNGKGVYKGPQYNYTGEYLEGKFNGSGTYENAGIIYTGFLKDNKFEGEGKLILKDSSGALTTESYTGSFKNNLKDGYGKYYFSDESNYDGAWLNDTINGKGTMVIKNKYKLQGTWVKGEMIGNGFSYYDNGDYYEGEFKNSNPHGVGTLYLKNGGKLIGNWKDGNFISGHEENANTSFSEESNIIKMKQSDGVCLINVKVNDLNADFVINSGSSETMISAMFMNELIKTNNISDSDIVSGKKFYKTNGEITDNLKIKIKKIKIGNAIIKNVIIIISDKTTENLYPSNHNPLLLGQNVLRELGNIQINYRENKLTIVTQ